MTAFLSGEMKDTVELNPAGAYGLYFSSFLCTIYASKQWDLQCLSDSFLEKNAQSSSAAGQVVLACG